MGWVKRVITLITIEKIEEWVKEVEERPDSAPAILRYIASRLSDLSNWNEELLAENIALQSGKKVEEYESRIANLEYQLDLLKRQLVGEPSTISQVAAVNILLYNAQGQVLRLELEESELASGRLVARFPHEIAGAGPPPLLLATPPQEELLFLFDSGRTATLPVAHLPLAEPTALDWGAAFNQEPRAGEELAAILPIARMSLFEFCLQASRRGYVKKIRGSAFAAHLANHYVGSGVKLQSDKTCGLVFCDKDDRLVLASKEGFLLNLSAGQVPLAIEEALRLGPADHIIAAFILTSQPYLLCLTRNGKVLHREIAWLEPAASLKTKGQPIISQRRRAADARLVGAAALAEEEWCLLLSSDGRLQLYRSADLFAAGSVPGVSEPVEILAFTAFSPPGDRDLEAAG